MTIYQRVCGQSSWATLNASLRLWRPNVRAQPLNARHVQRGQLPRLQRDTRRWRGAGPASASHWCMSLTSLPPLRAASAPFFPGPQVLPAFPRLARPPIFKNRSVFRIPWKFSSCFLMFPLLSAPHPHHP